MNTEDYNSALHVQDGIEAPAQINPYLKFKPVKKPVQRSVDDYVKGILAGNRMILSQAITLIESANAHHQIIAQQILQKCLPHCGKALRIGITGVPGVGKSTFIESFGNHLINLTHQIAVLAIDPSSERSKGSILGDKTRMESLANNPHAFIRPSPSGATLGGVTRKTRETIILCEAAGFDILLIETVGVGQSETVVHSMVDFFLLLMLAGAGDELQGIKRGIMEMADAIVINKADGDNIHKAELAKTQYRSALRMFPPTESLWKPTAEICSALENQNIEKIWTLMEDYFTLTKANGYFETNRSLQQQRILKELIQEQLIQNFYQNQDLKAKYDFCLSQIQNQLLSPYQAVDELMKLYMQTKNL